MSGLQLRIGVNTGEVVVGQPREVSSFVSGDAVNVAPFRLPAATSLLLLLRCAFRRQEAAPPDPVERLPKLSVAGSIPVVRFIREPRRSGALVF